MSTISLRPHSIRTFILGCMLYIGTLYLSEDDYGKEVVFVLLVAGLCVLSVGFISILFYRQRINRHLCKILASFLILFSYCLINYLYFEPSLEGLGRLVQLFLLITFMLKIASSEWEQADLTILSRLSLIFFIACLLLWIVSDFKLQFRAFFFNANSFGSILFLMLYFPIATYLDRVFSRRLLTLFAIGLGLALLFSSSNRSSWLSVIGVVITYCGWGFITKTKFRHQLFLWLLFICFFTFLEVYANYAQVISYEYNHLVMQYTDKVIDSGRQFLWPIYINAFNQQPFLGHGISIGLVKGADLVAHNLYLEFALQAGLVGLTIFCILLSQIWNIFHLNPQNNYVRLGGAFFIGGLIHENFEVTLIQGNIVIAMFFWLIIGITLSFSIKTRSSTH